jgi:transposase-like protein
METTPNKHPKTLLEAVRYFSDFATAHDFFAKMRWPDGAVCPRCGSKEVTYSPKYRRFQCKHGHKNRQFTVKTGTVIEDSPLGLDKWATAFWLEANAKNSISSYEVHRGLGVTQKSAWFMLHRIRYALKSGTFEKMGGNGGAVEADETYIGGKRNRMNFRYKAKQPKGSGTVGKATIMGILERRIGEPSQVRASVVESANKATIHPIIRSNVATGTHLYTDSWKGYRNLGKDFLHEFVDHTMEYVRGQVHTNGLENFWNLFKRCIKGTHVSVDPAHLERYVDSECFRFNNRKMDDGQRLKLAMAGMSGKRLTYKALTGALEQATEASGPGQA